MASSTASSTETAARDIFEGLEPHCAMIVGRRGSGKSVFACQLLEGPFREHFDRIFILCPTFRYNAAFDRPWARGGADSNVHIIENLVEGVLDKIALKVAGRGETLILLDDCAFDGEVRHKGTALTKLAFISRHLGISIWVITQKYNSVVKDFREQVSFVVLFHCKDSNSFQQAMDENASIPGTQQPSVQEWLKAHDHGKVVVRNDPPVAYSLVP